MRKVLRIIDSVSYHTGDYLKYFCFALVAIVVYDVILRYVFDAATAWAYDIAVMLGGTMYILSWAYTHLRKAHIRVDIIYTNLPPRGRALIDVIGTIVLALPLLSVLIAISFDWMVQAWKTNERWAETYWYPPAGPFRTMVWIAYILFTLQFLAGFFRDLYFLLKKRPYDRD